MYTSDTVYKKFIKAFKECLENEELCKFESAWQSLESKTAFYNRFLEPLSKKMDSEFEFVCEEFRCDFTIKDKNDIPLVRIESENAHTTASHEVEQLCQLLSPLKVLLISCDWQDSEREKWLNKWKGIIKHFNSYYPSDFKFCIIVGEWGRGNPSDDILRYYVITLSSDGEIFEAIEFEKTKESLNVLLTTEGFILDPGSSPG